MESCKLTFRPASRAAFTLLELTVVMAVLGLVAVAASSMLGSKDIVDSLQARQQAQVLATALRSARTTAIAAGASVRVQAIFDRRNVVGFRTVWDASPSQVLQAEHIFPDALQIRWSDAAIVFAPTGMSVRPLTATITGSQSSWTLDVPSGSGQVSMTRTAP